MSLLSLRETDVMCNILTIDCHKNSLTSKSIYKELVLLLTIVLSLDFKINTLSKGVRETLHDFSLHD